MSLDCSEGLWEVLFNIFGIYGGPGHKIIIFDSGFPSGGDWTKTCRVKKTQMILDSMAHSIIVLDNAVHL